jgi:hypothetical protein
MLDRLRSHLSLPGRLWRAGLIVVAFVLAIPAGWKAYDQLTDITFQARYRLIIQHRLWEMHPEYRGSPQVWSRTAARLLTDRQLMMRVRSRYGELAQQIELDYRRDLTLAQIEITAFWVAAWGLPVGLMLAMGMFRERRPKAPPPRVQPASVTDSRYLP